MLLGFSSVFGKNIYGNKATLLRFNILFKFDYLIGGNTLQMTFCCIYYSVGT